MPVSLVGILSFCAILVPALFAAPGPNAEGAQSKPNPYEWIDRLGTWLSAAEQHQPGALDASTQQVGSWSRVELQDAWLDAHAIIKLVTCRATLRQGQGKCHIEVILPGGRSAPWRRLNRKEEELLDPLLRRAEQRGTNDLAKRGAILHADIAMLRGMDSEPYTSPSAPRSPVPGSRAQGSRAMAPERFILRFDDGRQLSLDRSTIHWEFGRTLLDLVRPDPALDEDVRLWYQATSAYLQREIQLEVAHLDRAKSLFPRDPVILFLNGCLHESFAADDVQNVVKSAVVPVGVTFDVGSQRSELRQAETFLRRALEAKPDFAEARLRLGRVLGLLGRHADAERELGAASQATDDSLLLYYIDLFLGAEQEALGHFDVARQAYARAASRYPGAQSPHLAVAHLERREGNRSAALKALERVFDPSEDEFERDDPWWTYHIVQGRNVDELLSRLYAHFRSEHTR